MTDPDTVARNRWAIITLSRLAAVAGAIFGLVLIARAQMLEQKILGTAIVVSALIVMAVVPRALAHRWRTPPQ